MLLIGDGIKIANEGKKMPAVRSRHQDSQSNAKAEFTMGHYLQAFALAVVSPMGNGAAIPLVAQIHDGIVYSNRCSATIIDKFMKLFSQLVDIHGLGFKGFWSAHKTIRGYETMHKLRKGQVKHADSHLAQVKFIEGIFGVAS